MNQDTENQFFHQPQANTEAGEQSSSKRGRKKHQEKRVEAQEVFSVSQIYDALQALVTSEELKQVGISWEQFTDACWRYLHPQDQNSESPQFFDLKDFAEYLDLDYKVIYRIASEHPDQLAATRVGWQYRLPVVGAALYVLVGYLHLKAEKYETREFYGKKLNENPLLLLTAPEIKEKFRRIWQDMLSSTGNVDKIELQWPGVAGITEITEPPK